MAIFSSSLAVLVLPTERKVFVLLDTYGDAAREQTSGERCVEMAYWQASAAVLAVLHNHRGASLAESPVPVK